MAEHKDDFKEIEELLKRHGSPKMPEGLLSDFTREVLTRIEAPRAPRYVPGIWVLCAAVILSCVLSAAVWVAAHPAAPRHLQKKAPAAPVSVPARPAVADIPAAPAAVQSAALPQVSTAPQQTAAAKPRQGLSLDEEMRLLEEITGDSSFLEGVLSDEELVRHELGGMPAASVGR